MFSFTAWFRQQQEKEFWIVWCWGDALNKVLDGSRKWWCEIHERSGWLLLFVEISFGSGDEQKTNGRGKTNQSWLEGRQNKKKERELFRFQSVLWSPFPPSPCWFLFFPLIFFTSPLRNTVECCPALFFSGKVLLGSILSLVFWTSSGKSQAAVQLNATSLVSFTMFSATAIDTHIVMMIVQSTEQCGITGSRYIYI